MMTTLNTYKFFSLGNTIICLCIKLICRKKSSTYLNKEVDALIRATRNKTKTLKAFLSIISNKHSVVCFYRISRKPAMIVWFSKRTKIELQNIQLFSL